MFVLPSLAGVSPSAHLAQAFFNNFECQRCGNPGLVGIAMQWGILLNRLPHQCDVSLKECSGSCAYIRCHCTPMIVGVGVVF